MKKLNFNFILKNIADNDYTIKSEKGEEIIVTAYEVVPNALIHPEFKNGSKVKKFLLATKIYKQKKIEVDESDFDLIKKAVDALPTLMSGQLTIYLNSALDAEEKKDEILPQETKK